MAQTQTGRFFDGAQAALGLPPVVKVNVVSETAGDALWHVTDAPTDTQVEADTTPVVIGTRFTVDDSSTLVAIRYFRPPVYDSSYTLELRVHREA